MARAALVVAQRVLPFYTHSNSRKKFTQHQLFACLVLKNFLKTDCRGIVAHLTDHPALCEVLRLKSVPHFTTLQKAGRHLLASEPVRRVVECTIRLHYGRRRRVCGCDLSTISWNPRPRGQPSRAEIAGLKPTGGWWGGSRNELACTAQGFIIRRTKFSCTSHGCLIQKSQPCPLNPKSNSRSPFA